MIDESIKIKIEGKEYVILFSLNAMILFEEITGINMLNENIMQSLDTKGLRAFLYCSLSDNHPELSIEDVGKMIHLGNAAEISKTLIMAFSKAMPKSNGQVKKKEVIK